MVSKKTKKKKEKFSKRNRDIQKIVSSCNDILIHYEDDCNCKTKEGYPTNKIKNCLKTKKGKKCNSYNLCKRFMKSFMSGSEPDYKPELWEDEYINDSHNCYAYFLDDRIKVIKKKCKNTKKEDCDHLKPQPGAFSYLKGKRTRRNSKYRCPNMLKAVLDDNKSIKLVNFNEKCPKGHYKGYLVVDQDHTYHFYRQDSNGRWSHKQGTLDVENTDASDLPIYVPHLADKNYNKKNEEDGINYTELCSYMCVPNNKYFKTNAI